MTIFYLSIVIPELSAKYCLRCIGFQLFLFNTEKEKKIKTKAFIKTFEKFPSSFKASQVTFYFSNGAIIFYTQSNGLVGSLAGFNQSSQF